MIDPRKNRELSRLRDGSDDPFIRGLLESAENDGPRPGSKSALVASLGIGVGGPLLLGAEAARAAATTATSVVGATAGGTVTSSAVTSGAVTGGYVSLFGKWLAIGVASTTLIMSEARVDESHAESAPRENVVASVDARAVAPSGELAIDGPSTVAPEIAVEAAEKPSDTPTRTELMVKSKPTRSVVAKPLPSEPEPQAAPTDAKRLIDEVRALDDARAALERGDVSKASSTLSDKGTLFERGSLGQEAELLAIEIASKRGDAAAAQKLGNAFLAKYPTSPHRGRVESILRAK